eukprot:scaffold14415_cov56-Phaeocystis_antarctica.AAC.2
MVGCIKAISPPVCEERVGKAVPGLAHRVGAEWRGAHAGYICTGRTRCAMPPPLKLCTAGCTVGAQLKRRCQKPQGRA